MSWYRDALERVAVPDLIPELNPQEGPAYFTVTCPSCGEHDAFIYKNNLTRITCNHKNSCGASVAVYDYLIGREGSKKAAYDFIAQKAGMDAPAYSQERQAEVDQEERREDLLQTAVAFFGARLPRSRTEEYLIGRGFRQEDIKTIQQFGIGHFPGAAATLAELHAHGFHADEINKTLTFLDARDDYTLALPMITRRKVVAVMLRYTGDDPEKPRYLPLFSFTKAEGMHFFDALKPGDVPALTEGPLDALALLVAGVPAVAVGTNKIGDEQLALLRERKTKEAILSFDSDTAGVEGTKNAIINLMAAGIRPYTVDFRPYKDPQEAVNALGIEKAAGLYKTPHRPAEYLTNEIFREYQKSNEIERDRALQEAVKFLTFFERHDPVEQVTLLQNVCAQTGVDIDIIKEVYERERERTQKEEEQKTIQRAVQALTRDLENLSGEKALELIEAKLKTIRLALPVKAPAIIPLGIRDTLELIKKQPEGLGTGFSILDQSVKIKQAAVTVVAGLTGHGKTTFMLNVFVNMLLNTKTAEKTFLFLTYEEPREKLIEKLIKVITFAKNRNAGLEQRDANLLYQIRTDRLSNPIGETIRYIEEQEARRRIGIIDLSNESATALGLYIREWTRSYPIGAIFLDYVQKIPIENGSRNDTRQMELQRTSHSLLTAAKDTGIPLIIGAQLNRELGKKGRDVEDMDVSYIREAGDIGQDANLVLGVWNHAGDPIPEKIDGKKLLDKERDDHKCANQKRITVIPIKNREGPVHKKHFFEADWDWLGLRESGQ